MNNGKKLLLILIISFACLVFLSGCWNIREIQHILYVSAIGIDYDEEKKDYIIYTQMIEFSTLAKSESGMPDKSSSIWVGKATGKTLQEALNEMTSDAQQRIYWGHISSLVVSERFLNKNLKQGIDFLNRYREIRYNIWFFSSREEISKIFTTQSFFKLSPLTTILHEPEESYRQRSLIEPVRFFEYLSEASDKSGTVYIPSLEISTKHWTADNKKKELLRINGAHFLTNNVLKGWLSEKDLKGLQWINNNMVRSLITVYKEGKPFASVAVEDIKETVSPNNVERVSIYIKGNGVVNEILDKLTKKFIENAVEETIATQVEDTFNKGKDINADVLELGKKLNRLKLFGKMHTDFPNEIDDITVEIKIISTGKLKEKNEQFQQ